MMGFFCFLRVDGNGAKGAGRRFDICVSAVLGEHE